MINSIISLSVQSVVDLLWLPVQQYQEDGRIVWGLQRGTTSFASSTGIAVVELTNRALYSVHVCSSNVCIFVISLSFFHSLPPLVFSSDNV